jgi:hypothetical protein
MPIHTDEQEQRLAEGAMHARNIAGQWCPESSGTWLVSDYPMVAQRVQPVRAIPPENRVDEDTALQQLLVANRALDYAEADRLHQALVSDGDPNALLQAALARHARENDVDYLRYAADVLMVMGPRAVLAFTLVASRPEAEPFVSAAARASSSAMLRVRLLSKFACNPEPGVGEAVAEVAMALPVEERKRVLIAVSKNTNVEIANEARRLLAANG